MGMSTTPLTDLIMARRYDEAEKIIVESTNPSDLNDGLYDQIPLNLALSAIAHSNKEIDRRRHVELAKLLVQKGADPNLCGSTPNDCLYESPSPFEKLLSYYQLITSIVRGHEVYCEPDVSLQDLHCQLVELIDVFLRNGADPNRMTSKRNGISNFGSLLCNFPDMDMVSRFCNAGALADDITLHGDSTIMEMIVATDPGESLQVIRYFQDEGMSLNLDAENCLGENAVTKAMMRASPELAVYLMKLGCPPPKLTAVRHVKIDESDSLFPEVFKLPGLLSPLLCTSDPEHLFRVPSSKPCHNPFSSTVSPFHKHYSDKVVQACISPVIDSGCLDDVDFQEFIKQVKSFTHLKADFSSPFLSGKNLLKVMFGQVSAGLRQLCVRTLFSCLWDKHLDLLRKELDELFGSDVMGYENFSNYIHENLSLKLHHEGIHEMISPLGMPRKMTCLFQLEAVKARIACRLHYFARLDCFGFCDDTDSSSSDSSFIGNLSFEDNADSISTISSSDSSSTSSDDVCSSLDSWDSMVSEQKEIGLSDDDDVKVSVNVLK